MTDPRLDELLAVPKIAALLDEHRQHLAAAVNATVRQAEEAERRATATAELRALIERDPLVTVSIARQVRMISTPNLELAVPGDPYNGGRFVGQDGVPIPHSITLRTSQWDAILDADHVLRSHHAAGHLAVTAVPVDVIVAGELVRHYR